MRDLRYADYEKYQIYVSYKKNIIYQRYALKEQACPTKKLELYIQFKQADRQSPQQNVKYGDEIGNSGKKTSKRC